MRFTGGTRLVAPRKPKEVGTDEAPVCGVCVAAVVAAA